MPVRSVFDYVFGSEKSLLRTSARDRTQHHRGTDNGHPHAGRISVFIGPILYLLGSNHVVPGICTVLATSSFISTPNPGLSGGVT